MSSIQEIKEIAEELQLRGDEKKKFIIEQMDKLRKLQAEKEKEEREAKLQAEKEQRETEAKLKMEEMRTQLELAKIKAQASQQIEHNLTSGSTRSVHEERILNSRCLNYRLLWTERMTLILGLYGLSDSLPQVDGPRKAGAHHYQHC